MVVLLRSYNAPPQGSPSITVIASDTANDVYPPNTNPGASSHVDGSHVNVFGAVRRTVRFARSVVAAGFEKYKLPLGPTPTEPSQMGDISVGSNSIGDQECPPLVLVLQKQSLSPRRLHSIRHYRMNQKSLRVLLLQLLLVQMIQLQLLHL